MIYDPTAGMIETPHGLGRFLEFDGKTGTVMVELDHSCCVIFPADVCYIRREQK